MSAAVSDRVRILLLRAEREAQTIEIIAEAALSDVARGRVADALDVIRSALRFERLIAGMGAGKPRAA
jgi:hypothetical protein